MDINDFEDPTSFPNLNEELKYWKTAAFNARDLYFDTQIEIESVQKQMLDVSTEYENDIRLLEAANSDMRSEIERLKTQIDEWREKYKKERISSEETYTKAERELQFLKSQQEYYKSRTRDLEQDNDDLEKAERAIKSSLEDAKEKVKRLSKTNESLALEVKSKNLLVEEVQRLKDDLKDLTVELAVVKGQKQKSGRASLGGFIKTESNLDESFNRGVAFNDVITRMKGLESRIENARSLVSPLLQANKKKPGNSEFLKPASMSRAYSMNQPHTRSGNIRMSFEPKASSERISGALENTEIKNDNSLVETNSQSKQQSSLNKPLSFAASSETSRLRMARSRALRNEMRMMYTTPSDKEDQQQVPTKIN
ncbi:hypothetical protein BB559_000601 [Furculomyces boomerangus]|uniref:NUDE domain-containing protein n=1 Tax=Furculomyces boomerangus TaxID=61424 RepID=A0A2T9Z4P3_9FUNG|nr:hypothetical protein BB559_000601 [Furculomyces boomerangus]